MQFRCYQTGPGTFLESVFSRIADALRAGGKNHWQRLVMLAVFAALTACGGGSGAPEVAPKNLFYAQPPASLVGDPIAVLQATVEGPVNSYTVAPALPQGLTIDPLTGTITGIPSEAVTDGSYLVTATNKTGSTHFAVVFTISDKTQEEAVSAGSLALTSADPATLVNVASPLQFKLTGAQLPTTTAGIRVFNSGREIPPANISVQGNVITVSSALEDGRNDLVVLAADVKDGALGYQGTLWAGSSTLTVSVSMPDGSIPANATVVARLMDQGGVAIQQSTSSGQVTLQNVPNRTVLLSATAAGNLTANLTAVGVAGAVQLKLQGFTTASTIDNNDFTAGTAGWQPSSAGVISIVPHVEDITPVPQASVVKPSPLSASRQQERQQWAQQGTRMQAGGSKLGANPAATAEPAPANPDLSLTTSGEGPASVSRTFTVPAGASQVKIRYRFITSEVPGGYFGSQYNDSFSITARSQTAGGTATDANSMNSLGLAAFDANGSTVWRVLTVPVSPQGDTVQLDVTVTNVGDGILDSQVVVDFVALDKLTVTSNLVNACVNQTVTFQAAGASAASASWSGGQSPATGTGASFPTRFTAKGDYQVTASADGTSAQKSVHIMESSGAAWVARFPTSTSLADLQPGFGANATSFINAMEAAGASVSISATFRPVERAFLMHYAWAIAKEGLDPASVPEGEGIEICWVHRNASGDVDLAASKAAALAMTTAYKMKHAAALVSRHTQKLAVDMTITWTGDLTIKGADGKDVKITTTPRTGAGNTSLHAVGAGYSVKKLVSDEPHWSDDGH